MKRSPCNRVPVRDRKRAWACTSCRPSARSHALRRTPSTAKPVFSATRQDALLPTACSRSSPALPARDPLPRFGKGVRPLHMPALDRFILIGVHHGLGIVKSPRPQQHAAADRQSGLRPRRKGTGRNSWGDKTRHGLDYSPVPGLWLLGQQGETALSGNLLNLLMWSLCLCSLGTLAGLLSMLAASWPACVSRRCRRGMLQWPLVPRGRYWASGR